MKEKRKGMKAMITFIVYLTAFITGLIFVGQLLLLAVNCKSSILATVGTICFIIWPVWVSWIVYNMLEWEI